MGKNANKKERILVTKLNREGDVIGESYLLYCSKSKAVLEPILGEISNFSAKLINGKPNPHYIPIQNKEVESKVPHLEYDDYFNFVAPDGKKVVKCVGMYYREDIEDYYFYVEMLDRCEKDPRFHTGEFSYIGNPNTPHRKEF